MESLILLALLVLFILLGAPIGFTLILLPTAYILMTGAAPMILIPSQMFSAIDSVPLTAIPFFMLTGELPIVLPTRDQFARTANGRQQFLDSCRNALQSENAREVADVRPECPRQLSAIVAQCLEKDPQNRIGRGKPTNVAEKWRLHDRENAMVNAVLM